ncbi:histone-like nucleoid-structuring protein Lsr2, partial [Cellulomonas sp. ACRRI]|uniref:Lsr2 family DNA-binding protein n=1 Tax=Cellulomonas sp. ACRRI TaxID=2918188 RepID=UPI0021066556
LRQRLDGGQHGGRFGHPVAVQAAIETLTQWLRSGGMLVCASDDDGPPDADCAHGTGRAEPAPSAPAAAQPVPGGRDGQEAAAADPAGHPAATCRHCRVSDDPVAMRAWARERGFRVADRGRLPAAVVAAYVAAHPHT